MLRIVVALLFAVGLALPASAGKRVALVIGNSAYANAPALPNPKQDAGDVADAFGRLGFTVTKTLDATGTDMRRALIAFGREAQGAEMAAIFFAGHGMEIGGENWLIPVDAELRSDIDVDSEAISLRSAMAMVARASTLGMVVLDACRNNPFVNAMKRTDATRAVSRGLARVEPQSDNILVAYAARDGTTAADGSGRNSPFTTALLKNIETPGLDVRLLFGNVRDDVMKATARAQQPFSYASLPGGQIVLKAAPIAPPASVTNGAAGDEIVWNYIDREDAAALRRFAAQYPGSARVGEARAKVSALERGLAATTPAVVLPAPTVVAALPPIGAATATQGAAAIAECDRLAASPNDADKPSGVPGIDVPKVDSTEAIRVCQTALKLAPDDPRTTFQLGRAFFARADYAETRRFWDQAAKGNYTAALFGIGTLYNFGFGTERDGAEAIRWYEKAAARGSRPAMLNLGTLYLDGQVIAQDRAAARRWYEKAADLGLQESMAPLAMLYEHGEGGSKDDVKARAWYEKAAAAGNVTSMHSLGLMLAEARGGPQDYAAARSWYEKASAAGNDFAMHSLGRLFANEKSGMQDYAKARDWYEKSATAGNVFAMHSLGVLLADGYAGPADFVAARGWLEKAATAGLGTSMVPLGILYQDGRGVAQDFDKAREWYEKALAAGDDGAHERLDMLASAITQRDAAEAKSKLREKDKRKK